MKKILISCLAALIANTAQSASLADYGLIEHTTKSGYAVGDASGRFVMAQVFDVANNRLIKSAEEMQKTLSSANLTTFEMDESKYQALPDGDANGKKVWVMVDYTNPDQMKGLLAHIKAHPENSYVVLPNNKALNPDDLNFACGLPKGISFTEAAKIGLSSDECSQNDKIRIYQGFLIRDIFKIPAGELVTVDPQQDWKISLGLNN